MEAYGSIRFFYQDLEDAARPGIEHASYFDDISFPVMAHEHTQLDSVPRYAPQPQPQTPQPAQIIPALSGNAPQGEPLSSLCSYTL